MYNTTIQVVWFNANRNVGLGKCIASLTPISFRITDPSMQVQPGDSLDVSVSKGSKVASNIRYHILRNNAA